MLQNFLVTLYVFVNTVFCGCGTDRRLAGFQVWKNVYEIERVGTLPAALNECSGFAPATDSTVWAINDGGNSNELFEIMPEGKLLQRQQITGTRNTDWEALARDTSGYLYIGDFGNNSNSRKNLRVYKVAGQSMQVAGEIGFRYPDQEHFPPTAAERNFDSEALIWHQGSLYLFSKDWGRSRQAKLYRLPDQPGSYVAELLQVLKLRTRVTDAALSPDGQTLAVLGYGKLYLFGIEAAFPPLSGWRACIPIERMGQAESVVFLNNTDLLFSNEQGKIYKARKKR